MPKPTIPARFKTSRFVQRDSAVASISIVIDIFTRRFLHGPASANNGNSHPERLISVVHPNAPQILHTRRRRVSRPACITLRVEQNPQQPGRGHLWPFLSLTLDILPLLIRHELLCPTHPTVPADRICLPNISRNAAATLSNPIPLTPPR